MRIAYVASEVHPFSKTGGLADVASALPKALCAAGLDVVVCSPWYATLNGQPQKQHHLELDGEHWTIGTIQDGAASAGAVRFVFLQHHNFSRPDYYGYDDDVQRFAKFCAAVPYALHAIGFQPDVVHLNDWQTGLLAPLLRCGLAPLSFEKSKTMYTVHNLEFQGRWNIPEVLDWTGLPNSVAHVDGLEFFGDASCAKAGINFAHLVTTVSPSYAQEIQTNEFGARLEGALRQRGVTGILNGIDTDYWNPSSDAHLDKTYNDLRGKQHARAALVTELGLDPSRPTLGMVTRMSEQKGFDLVMAAMPDILERWNIVVLGSGEARYTGPLMAFSRLAPQRVSMNGGFNEPLAHRIYAGVDAFLMPSKFEPCGLAQMISMRYGTLPIVRRVGGLRDTVPETHGYGFDAYDANALVACLNKAADDWNTVVWQGKAARGMAENFSWERSAGIHQSVYAELMK